MSLGTCGHRRPRSACASMHPDQGLHCLLTESLDTIECMNGEQRPKWYFVHIHGDLNLHTMQMFKDTFSLVTTHIYLYILILTEIL